MEGNKDESFRCIQLSQQALSSGDYDKALRLANKAKRLFPSQKAEAWIKQLQSKGSQPPDSDQSSASSTTQSSPFTTRPHLRKTHSTDSNTTNETATPTYTAEQKSIVLRILSHNAQNYYEILEVKKTATDAEIKKAYRKVGLIHVLSFSTHLHVFQLALQVHPDKNTAPRASEAFKCNFQPLPYFSAQAY
jgi:DnaJ family protein B protein 12